MALQVTKVEIVALGLLAERPMHGWELLERFRALGMELWVDVGRASVYQALRRLEEEGSVTSRLEEGTNGPDRRVYRLVRKGKTRLRRALFERLGAAEGPGSEAGLALGFVHTLPAPDVRSVLASREGVLRDHAAAIRDDRRRLARERGAPAASAYALLDREAALVEADLAWMSTFGKSARRRSRRQSS
jgi:DNA-binding PadR family transcriptional regulator